MALFTEIKIEEGMLVYLSGVHYEFGAKWWRRSPGEVTGCHCPGWARVACRARPGSSGVRSSEVLTEDFRVEGKGKE